MEQAFDLPGDTETLRQLVLALTQEIQQLKAQQDTLQEHIRLLLHQRFGANSETYRAEQSDLFTEAEATAEDGGDVDDTAEAGVESVSAETNRAVSGRFISSDTTGQTRPQSVTPRPAPHRHHS
jgi:hypothetical protein